MDCSIGPLFFLHVNVSGGEPHEIQDNVREETTATVIVDDDGVSIIGAAVQRDEKIVNDDIYNQVTHFFC